MDWLDLLAVQETLKSLLQHHSSKALILQHSAFFIVQVSHPYMTTGKTIALTRWTFLGKVMSLCFNMLSRLVIAFLPRSKCLLISWLQFSSAIYFIQSLNSADVSIPISQEDGPILECALVLLVKYQLMIQQDLTYYRGKKNHFHPIILYRLLFQFNIYFARVCITCF